MSNKIFVGGIPKSASVADVKAQLSTYFSAYGTVKHAEVKCDQQGLSRGFGYIEFADSEATERAMAAYDQHKIGGKWVEVKRYSQPMGRASANACALARMASAAGQHSELPSHLRGSTTPNKATHKDAEALQQLLGAAAMSSAATSPGAMEVLTKQHQQATALASALYANAALAQQQAVMDGAATSQMLASLTNGAGDAGSAAGAQLLAALTGASNALPTSSTSASAASGLSVLGGLGNLGLAAGFGATNLGTAGLAGSQALHAALAAAAAGTATAQPPAPPPAVGEPAALPPLPPLPPAPAPAPGCGTAALGASHDIASQLRGLAVPTPAAADSKPTSPLAALAAGMAVGEQQPGGISQLAAIMSPGQKPAVQALLQQALTSAGVGGDHPFAAGSAELAVAPTAGASSIDASALQALAAHLGGAGFGRAVGAATVRPPRAAPY